MKPSTNKEECTIDVTANEIPFSCIVDGNESIKAWQIVIYDIITNDIVFDTGKITLKSSFYPVDEKNRNVVFSVNLKDYISGGTAFKNRSEAYYWTIALWGASGATTTSYQEVFYANKTPNVSLNISDGDILSSKNYTFRATYNQENGVQLKRYGWKIIDADSGRVLVDTITKNLIYGSADNIICNYDGFLNGGNYSVELYIETQNNTRITSHVDFSVSYATTFLNNGLKVETLKNEPAIMLNWDEAVVITGILKGEVNEKNIVDVEDTEFKADYPVDNQCSIKIPDKLKVVYDNNASLGFDISENSYIAFSTQLLSDDNATLFLAEGYDDDGCGVKRQLLYDEGYFTYKLEGHDGIIATATHMVKNKPSEYVWYNFFLSPFLEADDGGYVVELNVYESRVENCIYPSEYLYPMATSAWEEVGSKYFYPKFGNWTNTEA